MNSIKAIGRRKVLLAISQMALSAPLVSCTDSSQKLEAVEQVATGDTDLELLASVAYDLFPFPILSAQLYIQIGEQLLASRNPVLSEGLRTLREAAGNLPWKELDENLRISILTMMENSAFFSAIRTTSLEVLFRSEEVYTMVGYGGSAIETGGYINRGFDQIDWLTKE